MTSPEDVADKAISFIEDVLNYPLEPWQATTLRAMLTYPVRTRFAVAPPLQRKGFRSDHVVMDEGCTCFGTGYESYCPVHGNRGA